MLKIVTINLSKRGSTGNIARNIADSASKYGIETWNCYPNEREEERGDHDIVIGRYYARKISRRLGIYTGLNDCFSVFATMSFVGKLRKIQPDLIHLHNLHNGYVNLAILFRYIRKTKIPVVWTLHDCWAFTGHCPHFTISECEKWKIGCGKCTEYRSYPRSNVDRTRFLWKMKKRLFTSVENMTIVTPSQWLADLVEQSYLKDFPVRVISNGVNLDIFRVTEGNIRKKLGILQQFIVLGVASGWNNDKGLEVFIKLASELGEQYKVVLVGTTAFIERNLPKNIMAIRRTQSQQELAMLYSTADVFVNPTKADTFPTVNMEALACGTPVITYRTGGSPEVLDESCGIVVAYDDYDALKRNIRKVCLKKPFSKEACIKRAQQFGKDISCELYCKLYQELL